MLPRLLAKYDYFSDISLYLDIYKRQLAQVANNKRRMST